MPGSTTLIASNPSAAGRGRRGGSQDLPRAQAIKVNGVTVSRAAIARETQNHPAARPIDASFAAARALVIRELLLQEARRLAIDPVPLTDDEGRRETDEEALVRQLVEQEVTVPEADEASCRRIYDQQPRSFRSSDLHAVRHILFAAAPTDRQTRTAARARAQAVIDMLTVEPTQFAVIAVDQSACPSRAQGGSLGQISRGQTVPEFETALAAAPVGRVAPQPVETRYGFHVVIVDQRVEGQRLPFELVRSRIADRLTERARHSAIRQYICHLAGLASIEGITIDPSSAAPAR